MRSEIVVHRDALLARRMLLDPGEATPWHRDTCHRVTVVLRGERLRIEFADGGEPVEVAVQPGLADHDAPGSRVHRAVNAGTGPYEEVVVFLLASPDADPQPEAAGPEPDR